MRISAVFYAFSLESRFINCDTNPAPQSATFHTRDHYAQAKKGRNKISE